MTCCISPRWWAGRLCRRQPNLGIPSRACRGGCQLEAHLGVRLLQRTTRKLSLTDVGEASPAPLPGAARRVSPGGAGHSRAGAGRAAAPCVSCPVTLAQTVLAEVMPQFLALYPQVRVELQVSNRVVNLVEEGVDVALRVRASLEESGSMVVKRLDVARQVLVASPELLIRQGTPTTLADLARMDHCQCRRRRAAVWQIDRAGARSRWCNTPRAMWPTTCSPQVCGHWRARGFAGCLTTCAMTKSTRRLVRVLPTGRRRWASCMRCFRRAGACRLRCGIFWTFWGNPAGPQQPGHPGRAAGALKASFCRAVFAPQCKQLQQRGRAAECAVPNGPGTPRDLPSD